jgi:hypothetical protein
MAMQPNAIPAAVIAVMLAATGASAATDPKPGPKSGKDCFLSNRWDGWSAPGSADLLYLRVNTRDIYRVDLSPGTRVRKDPGYFLVNRVRGSNWICSPLDLDLTLSDHHGFEQGLIARSLRKLTPQEIAAIPRKDLP